MLNGSLSFEPTEKGELNIIFTVATKCDVDALTLDAMSYCGDVLYEPQNIEGSYESCLLCSEKTSIRFRTKTI